MNLNDFEEKILRRIHDLGPDQIYNKLFQDKKSQASISTLIRLNLIAPHFDVSDEQVEQFRKGQEPNRDDYHLHLALTEDGLAYYEEMYKPSKIFNSDSVRFKVIAWVCIGAMLLLVLWAVFS